MLLLVVAERLWILARHEVSGIAPAMLPASQRDGGNLGLAFAPFPRPFRTNSIYAPNQTLACLANFQGRSATARNTAWDADLRLELACHGHYCAGNDVFDSAGCHGKRVRTSGTRSASHAAGSGDGGDGRSFLGDRFLFRQERHPLATSPIDAAPDGACDFVGLVTTKMPRLTALLLYRAFGASGLTDCA